MALSIFDNKTQQPTEEQLQEILQTTGKVYDNLLTFLQATYHNVTMQWKFYSKKSGWSLVIKHKKTTLLYIIPQDSFFKVSIGLGEKAYQRAMESQLREELKQILREATAYIEGRSCMFDIMDSSQIKDIELLLQLKLGK